MKLFYVTRSLDLHGSWQAEVRTGNPSDEGTYRVRLAAPARTEMEAGQVQPHSIYACGGDDLRLLNGSLEKDGLQDCLQVLPESALAKFRAETRFPPCLGATRDRAAFTPLDARLAPFAGRESFTLAIVNGMGREFGDSIVGLRALDVFRRRLERRFRRVDIDLFRALGSEKTRSLYERAATVRGQHFLPVRLSEFGAYDAYVDLTPWPGASPADTEPMIDLILEVLSIDKAAIPDAEKRARVPLDAAVARELGPHLSALRKGGRPLLLFHPFASASERSMPPEKITSIVSALLAGTDSLLLCATKIDLQHQRFIDLSSLSRSFDHFACLVSQMDAVVTVDTATVHLADAFSVPTVALFTIVRPESRIRYYPYVAGILVGGDANKLVGRYVSTMDEARQLQDLWNTLDADEVIASLRSAQAKVASPAGGADSPPSGRA